MNKTMTIVLAVSLVLSGCAQSVQPVQTVVNSVPTDNDEIHKEQVERESPKDEIVTEKAAVNEAIDEADAIEPISNIGVEDVPDFYGLDDPELLQYIEDIVYAGLVDEFKSEDYIIENVNAVYYSKEYLQALAYNSKANIWFGYNLEELDEQFQGESYIFTLSDTGETVVRAFEGYDDTYDRVIRNVAIGTGVILICVTVSVVSYGVGAIPVSMIFAASAKSGAIMALSSGGISAAAAGAITAFKTGDKEQSLKAAALEGSEGFKLGAILGALSGGISATSYLRNPTPIDNNIVVVDSPEWKKAEIRALEKYKGSKQISYLAGKEVPYATPGATRPDVVRIVDNHVEAIEVKYFNLENQACRNYLYNELEREVADRVANLPAGSTQRVVLDVTGRNFSSETIETVTNMIQSKLLNIYGSNIPVDIMGL